MQPTPYCLDLTKYSFLFLWQLGCKFKWAQLFFNLKCSNKTNVKHSPFITKMVSWNKNLLFLRSSIWNFTCSTTVRKQSYTWAIFCLHWQFYLQVCVWRLRQGAWWTNSLCKQSESLLNTKIRIRCFMLVQWRKYTLTIYFNHITFK